MAEQDANLSESVAESANGPAEVSVAGVGASREHPIHDQIAAAKFKPNAATRQKVGAGIRFTKATAGGAV